MNIRDRIRRQARSEAEIYVVIVCFFVWYSRKLGGGIYMDEAVFARSGYAMISRGYLYGNPTHSHAPVGKYAIGIAQEIVGPTMAAAGIPSLIFGLGTIYITYHIGRSLSGRFVGLISAVFLGTNAIVAQLAPTVWIDMPLVFFTALAAYALLRFQQRPEPSSRYVALAVGSTVLACATKLQGALLVVPLVLVLALISLEQRWRSKQVLRLVKNATLSGGIVLGLVYWPFLLAPHPTYYGGSSLPRIAHLIMDIPGLGNIAYAFGEAFAQNLGHIGAGHTVTVAGSQYQNPPFWTYLYWVVASGEYVVLLGIASALAFLSPKLRPNRSVKPVVICSILVFVPYVLMSIVSVKSHRYLVPYYPIIIPFAALAVFNVGRRISSLADFDSSWKRKTIVTIIALCVVGMTIPPSIATDSGYDDATEHISGEISPTDQDPVTVLSESPLPTKWHFGSRMTMNYSFNASKPVLYDIVGDSEADVVVRGLDRNRGVYRDSKRRISNGSACYVVYSPSKYAESNWRSNISNFVASHTESSTRIPVTSLSWDSTNNQNNTLVIARICNRSNIMN